MFYFCTHKENPLSGAFPSIGEMLLSTSGGCNSIRERNNLAIDNEGIVLSAGERGELSAILRDDLGISVETANRFIEGEVGFGLIESAKDANGIGEDTADNGSARGRASINAQAEGRSNGLRVSGVVIADISTDNLVLRDDDVVVQAEVHLVAIEVLNGIRAKNLGLLEFDHGDNGTLRANHEVDRAGSVVGVAIAIGENRDIGEEPASGDWNQRHTFIGFELEGNTFFGGVFGLVKSLVDFRRVRDGGHERVGAEDNLILFRDFVIREPLDTSVEQVGGFAGVASSGVRDSTDKVAQGSLALGSDLREAHGINFGNDFGAEELGQEVSDHLTSKFFVVHVVNLELLSAIVLKFEEFPSGGGTANSVAVSTAVLIVGIGVRDNAIIHAIVVRKPVHEDREDFDITRFLEVQVDVLTAIFKDGSFGFFGKDSIECLSHVFGN